MRVLSFFLALFSVGGFCILATDAADFFELYTGINVWARSSFRLRRETSVEECARTCSTNAACSSFVYSRVTKYCYGRRKVDFTTRRHWHQSRRYDFYRKITGRDQRILERRRGRRDELVFVMRSEGSKEYQVIIPGRLTPPTTTTTTRSTTTTQTTTRRSATPEAIRFRQFPPITTEASTTTPRRRPVIRPTSARRRPITRPTKTTRTSTVRTRPTTRPTTTTRTISTTTRRPTTRKTTTTTTTTAAPPPITRPRTRSRIVPNSANRGKSDRCERAIGLEDGSFPYDQITASSYFWRFTPSNVGINSGNGWMASTTDVGEYLEIDFGEPKSIVAVATQGSSYLFSSEFVMEYKLKFLFHPGGVFETYKENEREKIFIGNADSTTIKKNRLSVPARAYKVQFHPLKFNANIMMRAEVFESC